MASEHLTFVARAACALGLLLANGFVAYGLASRLLSRSGPAPRLCATCVCACWVALMEFGVLIGAGWFRPVPAMILAGLTAILAWSLGITVRGSYEALRRDLGWIGRVAQRNRRSPWRWVYYAYVAGGIVTVLRTFNVPPLGWDSMTYHAVKAALWVQGGGPDTLAAPGGWGQYYRGMLGGGETFLAWAMLPFHSDLVVGAVDAAFWVGIGLVAYGLGRTLGLRARHAWAGTAYLLFVPALWLPIASCYVDVELLFTLLAGLFFAARFLRGLRPGDLLLSFLALGAAMTIKVTAWPVAAAAMVVMLTAVLVRGGHERRRLLGWGLGGLAAAGGVVLPWFALEMSETGFLLGYLPLQFGRFEVGHLTATMDALMHHRGVRPYEWATELRALCQMFRLPTSPAVHLSVLTALPLLLALPGLVGVWRRCRGTAILLGLAMAAVVADFYSPPFSMPRLIWANSAGRFLLPVVLVAVPVSLCLARRGAGVGVYAGFLLLAGLVHVGALTFYGWAWFEVRMTAAEVVLCSVVLGAWTLRRRPATAWTMAGACAVLLLALVGLRAARTRQHRYKAVARTVIMHDFPRYWTQAARAVDEPGRPRTVAVTAGFHENADNWFLYYFLGSRLQNRICYVPVTRDGRIADVHQRREAPPDADYAAWVKRVLRGGVDNVMCFSPTAVELCWMEAHPRRFVRLAGDATWGLFEVRRPLAALPARGGGNPATTAEGSSVPGPTVRSGVGDGVTK